MRPFGSKRLLASPSGPCNLSYNFSPFSIRSIRCYSFYFTLVCFLFLVIVDTHQQYLTSILCHLFRILLAEYLVDGGIRVLVVFQFQHDGWRHHVLTRDEHDVGKSPASRQFAVHHVVVLSIVVGYAQYTGQRVLVVIREDAGMLVVGGIHTLCHSLFVAIERVLQQFFRSIEGISM